MQFKRGRETLDRFFRQMTPNVGKQDFNVYADAYAAVLEKTGDAILVTHSQGGAVGWLTARETDKIKAIVSYEPGGSFPFVKSENPTALKAESGQGETVEITEDEMRKYTRFPIVIYYGDNMPADDTATPEQKRWRNRLEIARKWSDAVNKRGGVDYVSLIKKSDDFFVYRPKHKSAAELKTALSGLFGATVGGDGDRLIFKTSVVEIEKIKSLLKRFDVRPREVVVRGKIFEVTTKKTDASSLSIVADVFKKAGLAVSNGAKLVNYLSFKDKRVNAYWSALNGDDRFKLLSEPSLRIKSNTTASLTVGNDVPTLGSVTYQDGQPVQSVTYRSSGIIFEITPEVLDGVINLSVRQELSNFAETTSGVNNSPTLVKREIKTNISANSAELIVLGGLIENKNTASTAGLFFLPAFLSAKSNSNDKTEIILSLYVEILPEK